MSPSECYEPFMDVMMSKIQLSKLVIEFLNESPDASYEDLVNYLQTAPPLKGQTSSFSEDSLLRHSQWIVDQVVLLVNAAPAAFVSLSPVVSHFIVSGYELRYFLSGTCSAFQYIFIYLIFNFNFS